MARVMPQNQEAEMCILGIAFLDKYLLDKICESLNVDMFYDERNKYLFEAINDLHNEDIPLDSNVLKDELEKKKKLKLVGGVEYISEVVDSVISSANLDHYIDEVKENATRRNLINSATEIINDAYDNEDINSLIDDAERNILNVVKARTVSDFVPIHEILRRAQEKLEALAKNKKAITGVETGFYDFDKIPTGFQAGE